MRYLVGPTLLLVVALRLPAADPAKPNPLTPAEIADGWVLLFDGTTTFGWNIQGPATVTDGKLVIGGKAAAVATPSATLRDFDLRFQSEGVAQLLLDTGHDGPSLALANEKTQVMLNVQSGQPVTSAAKVKTEATGFTRCVAAFTYKNDQRGVLRFKVPAGQKLTLSDVKLKPAGLKPIFNGKDLSGWKVFPGPRYKSEFTVTPEGWLHIKNGPGDLQSEGQWDDFVLQIDCFTNGDRLNSGVFFRCRPNEYQNGYEAQIHNGFTAPPGKEYTVDEYDPVSHKLIDKKKVHATAIDYGTGAIYRRVPARFQAAHDREWFTMTVFAQGNHIMTWVNGLPMVDWTDNRPPSDNARNGCKLGKGPISLQGHDPTTDLSFRNLRIAPLFRDASVSQSKGGK